MRILIAGGAGYVGSALIPKIARPGIQGGCSGPVLVRQSTCLARSASSNKDIFHLQVSKTWSRYDQVIFLAGLSNDPMAEFSPSKNFIFNAAAPAYLAYTAKKAKVKRYVYASSCSVYGYTENELYDETRPVSSSLPLRHFQAAG